MKLILKKNTLSIVELSPDIKKYQISQLSFLGYRSYQNTYAKESMNIESDLLKLIKYFNDENIAFELSEDIKSLLEHARVRQKKHLNRFNIAKKIKVGEINKNNIKKFTDFLNTIPRKLKTHQIKAAYHLYSIQNGANFSVPGSGKTSVILSVYEKLRSEGKCNVLFVVGPPSCFQPWKHEFIETLGRIPRTVLLAGGDKQIRKSKYFAAKTTKTELYLSTFQTVTNDCDDVIKFLEQVGVNSFFVVDEAHYIKRLGGAWADSLLRIAEHTQFRCILTGTPMPRSYTDLFNQFDFLWPKENLLTDEDKIQISLWEEDKEHEAAKTLLDAKIGPLFYRVRKKDLGLKPAIFHKPFIISMKPNEKRIYELLVSKIHELSEKDFLVNREILNQLWKGRVIRLRQAISHPSLLTKSIESYYENLFSDSSDLFQIINNYDKVETTGKMDFLMNMVAELHKNGKKVLIWSNFIGTLEIIKAHFSKLNLWSELIYGKTPRSDGNDSEIDDEMTREKIRDIFVDPNSGLDILIANPAACAESISLHKTCFHAIYFDLSYNCAQYLQSLDRIHRVGGSEKRTANYYFLQYATSIDQDIKANLELKAEKMYSIIDQDYEIYNLDMFDETTDDDIAAYERLFGQKI